MDIRLNCFPGGRIKALTMSYDDGRVFDRRLVEIFNKYGIKGTFHLNSGFLGNDGYIKADEINGLYKGHEVSSHSVHHPYLTRLSREELINEVSEDRKNLERLAGYPVRGMSYPFGAANQTVVDTLPMLGIEYSRTVESHRSFWIPDDFLRWPATCHHKGGIMELGQQLLSLDSWRDMSLMYVWGHSYEFENDNNWQLIEDFCRLIGGRDDIWYATNIQIVDYMKALKALRFTVDGDMVYNPSAAPVWIHVNGRPVEIPGGRTVPLID